MTHAGDAMQKEAALNSILAKLNDQGKDSALAILKTLRFAQTAMESEAGAAAGKEKRRQPTRAG
ncbi:MAG: hypothetical protein HDT27_07880 [Subdoligranulum sp.]|nr:hypothetical protein [Subdoligranulum sp.]